MFIATANDLSAIPGPLRDRMEIISIAGYTEIEKVHIAKDHLFPKQVKENGLTGNQIRLKEEAILDIVRYYTREAGVRSLERQLAAICRKAAKKIVSNEKKRITVTDKFAGLSWQTHFPLWSGGYRRSSWCGKWSGVYDGRRRHFAN